VCVCAYGMCGCAWACEVLRAERTLRFPAENGIHPNG